MTNRPAGGDRSKKHEREPFDWYLDMPTEIRQLFRRFDFGTDLIYDPSCGRGNILTIAQEFGYDVMGSDIVDRWMFRPADIPFFQGDFLKLQRLPKMAQGRGLSIFNNPPYSYVDDIAEEFIRKALTLPINRAVFVLPIAFLASGGRWAFFDHEFKPAYTAILSDRPTMPPGSKYFNENLNAKGGMQDYMALVYIPPHRARTETIWIEPD